tara:strand:+ start:3783 stop:4193 length:411 start_codon:yes stop_codon:yes gene_type:complete
LIVIAIVAFFNARLYDPVTAGRLYAGIPTRIRVDFVAVITGLIAIDDAVTTSGFLADAIVTYTACAILWSKACTTRLACRTRAATVDIAFITISDGIHACRRAADFIDTEIRQAIPVHSTHLAHIAQGAWTSAVNV